MPFCRSWLSGSVVHECSNEDWSLLLRVQGDLGNWLERASINADSTPDAYVAAMH
eukprot:s10011_g1.t1